MMATPLFPQAESWEQRFRRFLRHAAGADLSAVLADRFGAAFPPGYRESTPPTLAGRDVLHLQSVADFGDDALELWQSKTDSADLRHSLRLYSLRGRFLDELLPVLKDLGLRVADHVQFSLPISGQTLLLTCFSVQAVQPDALPLLAVKQNLLHALRELLAGRAESDGLNGLLPLTGLGGREIDVFRGYRNYYLQLGRPASRESVHLALLHNPPIALLLYRYFEARFDPEALARSAPDAMEDALSVLRAEIAIALNQVADSSEDRILRELFNLIDATLRTSYFLRQSRDDYFFAFKIDSLGVLDMPSPSPLFEIYVHAAHMEGIHLRGAKVARGGIRWSDRPDDFRSEILGLMRTQTIKNAQIVPHGAKGGFIIKNPCRDREECALLAAEAYATLIRGLLDLTDNIGETGVVRPAAVAAYDDDDPYLVVAADKGTAHMSDTANSISAEYGFWLHDAFASGGSRGYDHKQLGITARGAWECVKRHFRELGRDMGQPFSVVGIGSMDGDVFGNGMLLTDSIRLKAAFGAKHIFLDPEPGDGAAALRERRRLFELPGSSWDDYDRRLISDGGGVFPRAAKDIRLAPSLRAWLGAQHDSIDGEGLIRLLLAAPVDLLWLGGIGTYIKASTETHEAVGDRANDAVRIDAGKLRAKIAGEGANLGFTQKARVEYALAGGRINNDAVDNSAGVDLSDHEVNLKILMASLLRKSLVADLTERDQWLKAMTAEVCGQVLANNGLQSLCLSLDWLRCQRDAEPFLDVADNLENAGLLDRAAESFPSRKDVLARPDKSLVRPELAVLMLHAKLALKQALLENQDFLALPALQLWLHAYFPQTLRACFAAHFAEHPLAREITATALTNTVINQAGSGILALAENGAAGLTSVVQAYLNFDAIILGPDVRLALAQREDALPAERQYRYRLGLEDLLADYCRWALEQGGPLFAEADTLPRWQAYFRDYLAFLPESLNRAERLAYETETTGLEQAGFDGQTARLLALLDRLSEFPSLAELAIQTRLPLAEAARCYRAVAEFLGLAHIESLLKQVAARDRWERRAQILLRRRFRYNLARLARALIESRLSAPQAYFKQCDGGRRLARLQSLQRELNESASPAILPYFVLSAELAGLAESCIATATA